MTSMASTATETGIAVTPEERAERRRAYNRACSARYYRENRAAIMAKRRDHRRRRYAEDPAYRARCVETQRQIRAKRRAAKAVAALEVAAPEVAA